MTTKKTPKKSAKKTTTVKKTAKKATTAPKTQLSAVEKQLRELQVEHCSVEGKLRRLEDSLLHHFNPEDLLKNLTEEINDLIQNAKYFLEDSENDGYWDPGYEPTKEEIKTAKAKLKEHKAALAKVAALTEYFKTANDQPLHW